MEVPQVTPPAPEWHKLNASGTRQRLSDPLCHEADRLRRLSPQCRRHNRFTSTAVGTAPVQGAPRRAAPSPKQLRPDQRNDINLERWLRINATSVKMASMVCDVIAISSLPKWQPQHYDSLLT
ncbi:hypothetical protein NDU88_006023 [Pleurodeles waltl]|uniref:Uncharacterized protein n=1 Tax=Pleurodeles waltl TaxID=8319 RepID=A0AAV7TVX9_PLEWA|nr:hypothetical protein NDU88_006023 [Pleurodeles waltl]